VGSERRFAISCCQRWSSSPPTWCDCATGAARCCPSCCSCKPCRFRFRTWRASSSGRHRLRWSHWRSFTPSCVRAYSSWPCRLYPRYLERAMQAPPDERNALQVDTFLWPTRWALLRERELHAGDVLTYDESAHFLSDLWSSRRVRVERVHTRRVRSEGPGTERSLGRRAIVLGGRARDPRNGRRVHLSQQ
jgi:hypothetical protein